MDKQPLPPPPPLEGECNTGSTCWRDHPCELGPARDLVCRGISLLNVKHHQGMYELRAVQVRMMEELGVPKDGVFLEICLWHLHTISQVSWVTLLNSAV